MMKSIRFGGPLVLNLTFGLPPMITTPSTKGNLSAKALLCQLLPSVKRVSAWKRSRLMQFDGLGHDVAYASCVSTLVGRILWLTRIFHRQETGALKTF